MNKQDMISWNQIFPPTLPHGSTANHKEMFKVSMTYGISIGHGLDLDNGLVKLGLDIVRHLGCQIISSDSLCMVWPCFMGGQTIGSADDLLCPSDM